MKPVGRGNHPSRVWAKAFRDRNREAAFLLNGLVSTCSTSLPQEHGFFHPAFHPHTILHGIKVDGLGVFFTQH